MLNAGRCWRSREVGRRLTRWPLVILAAWLVVVSAAWGDEDEGEVEQPLEEVFQSELVYPQEKGEIQLTLAPQWQSGEDEESFQSRFSFEYGITDALQIGVEWDVFSQIEPEDGERVEGVGDLELGFKFARMDPETGFHYAFGVEVGVPLGDVDDGLSEGLLEVEPFVIVARDFPRGHQLFAQLGLGLVSRVERPEDPEEEEPEAHELEVGLGMFYPVEPVVFTLELNWATNTWNRDGEENELYLTPGLVWPFADDWEAGLGVPIGLNDDADDHRVIFMLTAEL